LKAPETGAEVLDTSKAMLTPAQASPNNGLPEYPAYALEAGCGEGRVPVRVYIGVDGNVSAQRDVPDRPLPNDQCHMAFRAAVQSAVRDWKFAPAFVQKPLPGLVLADGKTVIPQWESNAIPIYVDLEFSFEVVEGKGVVRSR